MTLAQWEANNVSQWANATQPTAQYAVTRTKKFGILVTAQDQGAVHHLHFVNINMHGINGFIDNSVDDSKFNGGMFFDIGGSTTPTYFDDLLVQGCRIADIDRTGVSNRSTWTNRTVNSSVNWTPTLNYVLRNNTFERTGAQGLIVRDSKNPLIEHNLFDHCSVKTSGNACFNFDTDGALWQFNESRFTRANVGDTDAGGIDSDFKSKGTIMQYNYLHDNDYGLLITGGAGAFNDSTILRYNILERNGLVAQNSSDGKYQIKVSGTATRTIVHNNVFYVDSTQTGTKPTLHKQFTDWPDQTSYYNNVFYLLGPSPTFDLGGSTNNLFSNNLYYGSPIVNKPVDAYAVNGNPDMVAPGTGPNGYKLQPGSSAIAKGKLIPTIPALDYFQNPINQANAIDIGAQQFSSVPPPVAPPALIPQQIFGIEDAHVEGGTSTNTNFGTAAILRVKNNPTSAVATRQSYIKYDLSGVTNPAAIVSVQLVVNSTVNPTGTIPLSVFAVNDDTWHENTITDANQPGRNAYVTTLVASGNMTNPKQFSVDITNYALSQLNGDKTLSLVLADTTGSSVLANVVSREGVATLQHYLLFTTRGTIAPPPVAKSKFDIYLLIGQSNMAGRAEISAADRDSLQNVLLFTGTSWEKATNPLNKYSTVREALNIQLLGPGYTFGRKLAARMGQTIGLVVNARGSTSISQWQKGYSGANDFDLYEQAVAQLRKVQGQGTFKGIIWHQGESDQSNSGAYLAKFQQLVTNLRQDLGANVPIVAGELGKWRTSSVNLNAVIQSIPANVTNGYYVTADGLTPLNGDLTEPHFDGLSQHILGERYADRIASVVYNLVLAATPSAAAAQVQAYPSPTHGLLSIVRPAGTPATTATLLNTLGQVVRTLPLPTPETTVELGGLAPGIYTLRLTLGGQPVARRIVLE
ncbi:hypothetical protein A0257_10900 [Hymenobacter psoromatis]|nr:hypothetical protein A0257_10900 [Hymenobacter psoromatis]